MANENDDLQDTQDAVIDSQLNKDMLHLLTALRKAYNLGEEIDNVTFKGFLRSVLGFFANLICCPSIRLFLRKDN